MIKAAIKKIGATEMWLWTHILGIKWNNEETKMFYSPMQRIRGFFK